jgi:hypothetical protein
MFPDDTTEDDPCGLQIKPGQIFSLVYSVRGWLEPRGSLAAAASTALGGFSKQALTAVPSR